MAVPSYWYRIDLDIAPAYEPWRPDSLAWARSIDWVTVNAAALQLLGDLGPEGDLLATTKYPKFDRIREGLESLVIDPMDITDSDIYNGGHRATAMREQRTRFTIGYHFEPD